MQLNLFGDDLFTRARALHETPPAGSPQLPLPALQLVPQILSRVTSTGITTLLERLDFIDDTYDVVDFVPSETYEPRRIRFHVSHPHPSKLIEAPALESVAPPTPTAVARLPRNVIEKGLLSDVQREFVVYADQIHRQTTKRANGDEITLAPVVAMGGGGGKGRTIGGITLNNYAQGKRRILWLTLRPTLFNDAVRDLRDLGLPASFVKNLGDYKINEKISHEGMVVGTYARTRSTKTISNPLDPNDAYTLTAIQQIIDWKPDLVILDECQALARFIATAGERGVQFPSEQARMFHVLDEALPKSRFVFVSATAAKNVNAFVYAGERLALYGPGKPFPTAELMAERIESQGLAGLETLAKDLKASGKLFAPFLSTEDVTFETIEHKLTADQVDCYNTISDAVRTVEKNLSNVQKIVGLVDQNGLTLNGKETGRIKAALESSVQRMMRSLNTSFMLDSVVPAAQDKLTAGESVLFQIDQTGEAILKRRADELAAAGEEDASGLSLAPTEHLVTFMNTAWPVYKMEAYLDDKGNQKARPALNAQGERVADPEAMRLRDEIIATIKLLAGPISPIERLRSTFPGLAEMTGRTMQLGQKNGMTVIERRKRDAITDEIGRFNNDETQVGIYSESAGGVGISLHASVTFKNQRRRNVFVIDTSFSTYTTVQASMRPHRTAQVSAPNIIYCGTDVPAMRRFLASIRYQVAKMMALTRGGRSAGQVGIFAEIDHLETDYGRMAIADFTKAVLEKKHPGMNAAFLKEQLGEIPTSKTTVHKFMNKLLRANITLAGDGPQQQIMDAIDHRTDELVLRAKQAGTYDDGFCLWQPISLATVDRTTLYEDKTGAKTELLQLDVVERPNGIDFDRVKHTVGIYRNLRKSGGFYLDKKGMIHARIPITKGNSAYIREYRILTPVEEMLVPSNQIQFGTPVNDRDAELAWANDLKKLTQPERTTAWIVAGTMIPVWDRLPKSAGSLMRFSDENGTPLCGRRIPAEAIEEVKSAFGIGKSWDANDAWHEVNRGGSARLGDLVFYQSTTHKQPVHVFRAINPDDTEQYEASLVAAGCEKHIDPWRRTVFVAKRLEAVKNVAADRPFVPLTIPADELDMVA